LSNLVLAMANQ